MRANKRRDTGPELQLRSMLHAMGLRYRVDYALTVNSRRVHVDIAFIRTKVAVFVDGCFWHHCPLHGAIPKSNPRYWQAKLRLNVERDARVNQELTAGGWTVLRFWEHSPPQEAAADVVRAVTGSTSSNAAPRNVGPEP